MASRDLDIVVRAQGASAAAQQIGQVDAKVKGLGVRGVAAGVALGNLADRAISKGVNVLFDTVHNGLQSLADLESATTSVDGAIKQMGLTGQVTATQVAEWANQIETSIGGAFDDTAITRAATTLLRFGKVSVANLQPALVVTADLAAKTGDVASASTLLAKALAAPEKAAGRLSRAGVILTKSQQHQIKALVKAGKVGEAQKLILDAVATATKGAAAATQGPYTRSLSVLHDTVRDAERALGEGFLPVIEEVRSILSTELAKPQTLQNIRDFGKGLAGGLQNLINIAKGLPWDSIGNALRIGGAGAKFILDAFIAMPPWVQTAIATGWGLNKLTGGALSGTIGQLASGLVKGVLGLNAGVVNARAGVVNVVGGGGSLPSAAGGVAGAAKTGISALGKVFLVGEAIGLVLAVNEVRDKIAGDLTRQTTGIHDAVSKQINDSKTTAGQLQQSLSGVEQGIEKLSHDPIGNALLGDQLSALKQMRDELGSALVKLDDTNKANFRQSERDDATNAAQTKQAVDRARDKMESARIAIASVQRTTSSGDSAIVAAIKGIKLNVQIATDISVSDRGAKVKNHYTSGSNVSGDPSGSTGVGHHN